MWRTRADLSRGFTLIELLVVIAIISLLATVVLASVANARRKGVYSKAAVEMRSVVTALELFYQEYGDWPPVGNSIHATTAPGGGWDTLGALLGDYLPGNTFPSFPTINVGSAIYQGFAYTKGTSNSQRIIKTFDSHTGAFMGCIYVNQGYYISFILPEQSAITLSDGGIDPDGLEYYTGDYVIRRLPSECP